jgi:hypothetical protein
MAKKQKRNWFQTYLHDYEVTVAKFIPATPPKSEDERNALYDDVLHVLDIRSELEKMLEAQPELSHYREQLAESDTLLWQKRATVIELLSPLSKWRERWGCPASHWWWRLDELKRKPAKINGRAKAAA